MRHDMDTHNYLDLFKNLTDAIILAIGDISVL